MQECLHARSFHVHQTSPGCKRNCRDEPLHFTTLVEFITYDAKMCKAMQSEGWRNIERAPLLTDPTIAMILLRVPHAEHSKLVSWLHPCNISSNWVFSQICVERQTWGKSVGKHGFSVLDFPPDNCCLGCGMMS